MLRMMDAIKRALKYRDIELENIREVEENVGYIWFYDAENDKRYSVIIEECNYYER